MSSAARAADNDCAAARSDDCQISSPRALRGVLFLALQRGRWPGAAGPPGVRGAGGTPSPRGGRCRRGHLPGGTRRLRTESSRARRARPPPRPPALRPPPHRPGSGFSCRTTSFGDPPSNRHGLRSGGGASGEAPRATDPRPVTISVAAGAARPTVVEAPLDSRWNVDRLRFSRFMEEIAWPLADTNDCHAARHVAERGLRDDQIRAREGDAKAAALARDEAS